MIGDHTMKMMSLALLLFPLNVLAADTASAGIDQAFTKKPVAICDDGGACATVTNGKLDVEAAFSASDGLKVQVTNEGGTNLAGVGTVLPVRTDPTSVTTLYVPGGATATACKVDGATAATQCAAAPGLAKFFYVAGAVFSNGGTAQTVQIVQGTGTNCGTGQSVVTPVFYLGVNDTRAVQFALPVPLKGSAANEQLCCKPSGSTAFSCLVTYYVN